MNIEEYISSGILESYVLGALDPKEAEEVETKAALYPVLAEEIKSIQLTMETYAIAHAVKPSDRVKKKLFKEIENRKTVSSPSDSAKTIAFTQPVSHFNWMLAASVTVAVFSTSASVYFWNKWQNTEVKLVAMQQENQIIAYKANQVIQTNEQQLKANAEYFSFVTDTSTTRVAMKGAELSPSSIAIVFWNKKTNEVYLDVQSLPIAPAGMQYQLWALQNGVMVDAGMFDADTKEGLQKMKSIEGAKAFAVTLEKTGGSPNPTLDALYVIGTI